MMSHSPEQAAIASGLVGQLDAYEEGLRNLLLQWDPEKYRELSDRFDQMQMQATLLPKLAVSWTELLITRVDLMHALWSFTAPSRINGKVVALHARHKVRIEEVRRKCREYVAKGERLQA